MNAVARKTGSAVWFARSVKLPGALSTVVSRKGAKAAKDSKPNLRAFAPLREPLSALLAVLLLAATWKTSAAPEFQKDVRPILETYCFDCHADGANKGGVAVLRNLLANPLPATGALIKELAGVGWHGLRLCGGAVRAGDNGFHDHKRSPKHGADVGDSGRQVNMVERDHVTATRLDWTAASNRWELTDSPRW